MVLAVVAFARCQALCILLVLLILAGLDDSYLSIVELCVMTALLLLLWVAVVATVVGTNPF